MKKVLFLGVLVAVFTVPTFGQTVCAKYDNNYPDGDETMTWCTAQLYYTCFNCADPKTGDSCSSTEPCVPKPPKVLIAWTTLGQVQTSPCQNPLRLQHDRLLPLRQRDVL